MRVCRFGVGQEDQRKIVSTAARRRDSRHDRHRRDVSRRGAVPDRKPTPNTIWPGVSKSTRCRGPAAFSTAARSRRTKTTRRQAANDASAAKTRLPTCSRWKSARTPRGSDDDVTDRGADELGSEGRLRKDRVTASRSDTDAFSVTVKSPKNSTSDDGDMPAATDANASAANASSDSKPRRQQESGGEQKLDRKRHSRRAPNRSTNADTAAAAARPSRYSFWQFFSFGDGRSLRQHGT